MYGECSQITFSLVSQNMNELATLFDTKLSSIPMTRVGYGSRVSAFIVDSFLALRRG